MTPELQHEFRLFSDAAKRLLKEIPVSGSYRHVFSIWTFPSFSPASRCTVYSPLPFAKGKQPFADFTTWRSDLDYEKFRTPVERLRHPKGLAPTIENEVVWLTDDKVTAMEDSLRGIPVPFYLGRSTVVGCDGTAFEFKYDEVFFGASLHWWENHPAEWRPFIEAVTRIVDELRWRKKAS